MAKAFKLTVKTESSDLYLRIEENEGEYWAWLAGALDEDLWVAGSGGTPKAALMRAASVLGELARAVQQKADATP